MLILMLLASADAMAGEIVVTTAAGLRDSIRNHSTGYIRLAADIDLTQIDAISTTFSGTIDGEGEKDGKRVFYSLSNGNGKSRVNHPIFKHIEGATLKNLLIRNFRIEWDDDDIGAVAYSAKNCKFSNVIVSEVSIFNDDDEAGAIVGKAEGCDFRMVKGMGNDVTVDGTHAGGFVGISYNSVYCDCSNSAYSTVYADGSWGNAYAGGFVGESKSDQFVFCVNFASVGALDDRIGGIVGYAANSFFTNCSNSGYVMHCEEEDFITSTNSLKRGLADKLKAIEEDLKAQYDKQEFDLSAGFVSFIGTIGLSAATFGVELGLLSFATAGAGAFTVTIIVAATGIVVSCINLIDAEIGAHDEMGGICGTCEGSVFDTSSNYGTLFCRDSYVGGIVGLMRNLPTANRIIHCLNAGEVKGFEWVGGIFGQCQPADEISHCLHVGKVSVTKPTEVKNDPIGNVEREVSVSNLSKNYYRAAKYDPKAEGRIPVTADLLADGSVARWLNDGASSEHAPWHQTIGTDMYPVPDPTHETPEPQKHDNVFAIASAEDFKALRESVNNGKQASYVVYIEKDIDCSDTTWVPIGTSAHPFSGICFGNGHTISNLHTSNDKTKNAVGLFGAVGINTEVRDLIIGSGRVVGGNGVGALIGYCDHKAQTEGTIRLIGCGNAATIEGNYDCGGLIGAIYSDHNMRLILDNCYNTGAVSGSTNAAALCGFAKENATVTSCWNAGVVTGYEANKGFVRADPSAALKIYNCYYAEDHPELLQTGENTYMYSFSPLDAQDGTLCLGLNGMSNDTSVGLPWEQDISSGSMYPTYRGKGDGKCIYTSRDIQSKYGTVTLPYTVKSDDHIRYYVMDKSTFGTDDTQVRLNAVEVLPAGTPAIFIADTTGVYDFIGADENFDYTLHKVTSDSWTMTGNLSISDMEFTGDALSDIYYISGGQLRQATSTLTIAPFRAFLHGPVRSSSVRDLKLVFDDGTEPTVISLTPVGTQDGVTTYGIFNLAGQRLDAPQRGINIVRGKKFLHK